MMTSEVRYGPQDAIILWAKRRMKEQYPGFSFRSDAQGIGRVVNDVMVGAVIFHTWADGDCLINVVSNGSRRWLTREFIICAMAYPFVQAGNRRISALVSELNTESIELCERFGSWTKEGVLRAAGPDGEDMILYGMLKSECQWIAGL